MIAKSVKGKGFRGALDYDLGKEAGRLLDTNMAGQTPRQLSAEFGSIRKLRPNLVRLFYTSPSPPPLARNSATPNGPTSAASI